MINHQHVSRRGLLVFATLLAGLAAGFFYTYEASVTLGLAEVGDVAYVETFRAINDTIRNPVFGTVFFGSMPALALAAIANWRASTSVRRVMLVVAPLLYFATMAITFVGNVPLNDGLAKIEPGSAAIAGVARADFETDWNRLNLIRTITAVGSFGAIAGALAMGERRRFDVHVDGFGSGLSQTV